MTDQNDRRHYQRIHFDAPVEISQGKLHCFSKMIDISLKGILIKSPGDMIDISQPVEIRIHLSDEVHIVMTAEWANEHKGCMAFSWTHVDIESMMHLRRLLELNTGDESLIERELFRLIGGDAE